MSEGGFLLATGTKKEEKGDKKAEKAATVADLTARLKASSTAVLADYRGMTVGQMRDLRSKLRGGGIDMLVVQNTLAGGAAKARRMPPAQRRAGGPDRDAVRRRRRVGAGPDPQRVHPGEPQDGHQGRLAR